MPSRGAGEEIAIEKCWEIIEVAMFWREMEVHRKKIPITELESESSDVACQGLHFDI